MRAGRMVVLSVERLEARMAVLKVEMRVVSWDLR